MSNSLKNIETGGTANGVRDGRRLDKWIVTIPPQSI